MMVHLVSETQPPYNVLIIKKEAPIHSKLNQNLYVCASESLTTHRVTTAFHLITTLFTVI